jgi:hypothetical protein
VGTSAEETRLGLTSAEAFAAALSPWPWGLAGGGGGGGGGVMRGEVSERRGGVVYKRRGRSQVLACLRPPHGSTRLNSTQHLNPTHSTFLTPNQRPPPRRPQDPKMKLILAALTALVAATMAAPSAEAARVPAVADVVEARKCLRAGGMLFLSPWRDVA